MATRIIRIPEGMTWGEFRDQFAKFFPISNEAKRESKLKAEYYRLTGINPDQQDNGQDNTIRRKAQKGNRAKPGKGFVKDN